MKKFLSLVLALVMTMSLVTISAGATEFKDLTDVDSIEHKEAVELFNKIGIITGYEDGSFGPEKTITREQAAKIIAIMALGNDAASKLGVEKAPFPDVPATSQFAGYIGYCASTGIINGYNDGTFKPKGTLTGYQFAKMLLGVLGYGVKDEYVGTNWALNVARDGATIGLFDDATVTAGLINRDNATQIAFNALNSNLVTYSELLGTYTAYNMMTQTLLGTLASNIFSLTTATKTDGYGYNTHAWRQNGKIITGYYMTDKVLGTETDSSLTGNQLFNAYGWDVNANGTYPTVPVYVNGTLEYNWDPSTALKSVATKYIAKGYTVNFVDVKENINGNMVFDGNVEKIIVTIPYLAEVTAVKAATSSANRSVTLKVYAEKSGQAASWTINNVETEEFEKGDYILITPSSNTSAGFQDPLSMVKAQSVEGKVTAYYSNSAADNNGSVTVDGTKYNYNFIFASSKNLALGDSLAQGSYLLNKSIYTFFLDDVGNVIGVKVKEDAINDYAYVIAVGHDSFGKYNIVKVLTSDGKIGTYTVSSKSDTVAYDGDTTDNKYAAVGEIYAYSINSSNEIVLDKVQDLNATYDQVLYSVASTVTSGANKSFSQGSITKFTKGYSLITMSDGSVAYATDSTVFMYLDGSTVTTYVGKSNAPSITSAKYASVVRTNVTEDGRTVPYATYIVVTTKPENTMTDNYLYVMGNYYGTTQDVNGDTVYLYKTIKDGSVVNLAMDANTYGAGVYLYGMDEAKYTGDTANSVEAGLYSLTAATAGAVGGGTTGDYKANVVIGVSSNDNVIVTPANNDQFVISPDTKITDISNPSDIITNASFKIGDTVTIVYKTVSGLQVADAIYINSHAAVTTTTGAKNLSTAITSEANGAFLVGSSDASTVMSGIANVDTTVDLLVFKFAMPVATSQTVTLTVTDSTGTLIYKDSGTIADTNAHYFYAATSGSVNNTGSGSLAGSGAHNLAAGTYNYTIEGSVSGLIQTGSFTK